MEQNYYSEEVFRQVNFIEQNIAGSEFEECRFEGCNFSHCDLQQTNFIQCQFVDCSFMMAKTVQTGWKDVTFKGCKLTGTDFSVSSDFLFQLDFDTCQLDYALFSEKKMKNTRFVNCSVKEVDFTKTFLSGACFDHCDLSGAVFSQANLEKADFRSAYGFSIDPDQNRMKGARFSLDGLPGLLDRYKLKIE